MFFPHMVVIMKFIKLKNIIFCKFLIKYLKKWKNIWVLIKKEISITCFKFALCVWELLLE